MRHSSCVGRRRFLRWTAGAGSAFLGGLNLFSEDQMPGDSLPAETDRLLDEITRRACRYFYEQADTHTGLIQDRARMEGTDNRRVASIAATGFGLSSLCIADRRRYVSMPAARSRVERTLEYLVHKTDHEHGFFYHFIDSRTGARVWKSEISSIDTTWLLCGVLHCRAHWESPRIKRLASDLIERVNWRWMLSGHHTLCHGWTPEKGFLSYQWDSYSELMAMYLLAIGSNSYAIPVSSWDAWKRPVRTYEGLTYIHSTAPLFVHQYPHAWFDLRGRRDRYTDYFDNSQKATRAHRHLCIALAAQFPWYGPDMWGVTSADSARGYRAWGSDGCPPDGTLVPCAAGGSIAFLPQECSAVLRTMLERYGNKVWGRYGFVDAFQPADQWFSPDVIGINQGIMMMMAENARGTTVWDAVMSASEAGRGLEAVGLVRGSGAAA
jgi:hypothetical protein